MPSNPYYNQDFLHFFWVLLQRLWGFATGQIGWHQAAADEVQLAVLACVAASSALIGMFLVLRRMTMLANAISHTILIGIVLVFLLSLTTSGEQNAREMQNFPLPAMLLAALVTGVLTSFLTQFLTSTMRLQEDASIGMVFHTLFALGIVLVTLFTRNAHIGLEAVMGNADALQPDDIRLVLAALLLNTAFIVLCFKELKITTFDPQLAQTLGISAALFNYLLMLQVSIACISAFRAVGVIMVLAFMTGPPLTACLLSNRLTVCLAFGTAIGVGCALTGVALARHILSVHGIPLSTAGLVVCIIALVFLLALLFAPERGVISHWRRRRLELAKALGPNGVP